MAHSPIPHDLVTVANFADTLDALPLELTRGFSDLRELDAVLSSSLIHLTESIKALTAILLDPTATPAERLAILREVAVFAQRFKLGGEDKIRVVGGVCEGVISHQTHLLNLLSQSTLLTARSATQAEGIVFLPPTVPGKRTRATRGGANAHADPSASGTPQKKQRKNAGSAAVDKGKARQDDWDDNYPAGSRSPAKANVPLAGAAGRRKDKRKADPSRNGSPALSAFGSQTGLNGGPSNAEPTSRLARGTRADSFQPKNLEIPNAVEHLNLVDSVTSLGDGYGAGIDNLDAGDAGKRSRQRGGRVTGNGGKTSRYSSPETTAIITSRAPDDDDDVSSTSKSKRIPALKKKNSSLKAKASANSAGAGGGSSGSEEELLLKAGRGVLGASLGSFASSRFGEYGDEATASVQSPAVGASEMDVDAAEAGDRRNYCYCNDISYGEMIGCDDMDCEIEWFHLTCLNLDAPPAGTWHCPTCAKRRADAAIVKERQKQARGARGQARAAR